MEFWLLFFPVLIAMMVATQSTRQRRRKRMKPRVWVKPDEFLRILEKHSGRVIVVEKRRFVWRQYWIEGGDYFYGTFPKEPLELPAGTESVTATAVSFW